MKLTDRTILITGGSAGIGLAFARKFLELGNQVVVTGRRQEVLEKLKAVLQKSTRPEAKQQLAGWKVVRNAAAQPDGTILYVHVLSPVVKDADYSIINLVYDAFPDYAERRAFYDMYSGSVKSPLFAIQGPVVDIGK